MAIRRDTVVVTTAGGAGEATGEARTAQIVDGIVRAVHIAYTGAPATTDVVVAEANREEPMPVLSVANSNTAGWYFPVQQAVDAADATEITGVGVPVVTADYLMIEVDDANNNNTVTVTVVWETV